MYIGGRLKLAFLNSLNIATSFKNKDYIKKVLNPIVKPLIKRGK